MSKESESWASGRHLIGWDETGAGNLCGSLFVCGVIFPINFDFSKIPGLNDSKKLTDKRRFELEGMIKAHADWWVLKEIPPAVVDAESAHHAKLRVMGDVLRAGEAPIADLDVIFDGNFPIPNVPSGMMSTCLIKGDLYCKTISAASIIAKCAQRRQMVTYAAQYPDFEFEKNSGYYSDAHLAALLKHGPTPLHRRTYIKNFYKG